MIPVSSAVPIPVPTTVPLPAPTTVPVPAPSAVPLPVPTMRYHSPRRRSCRSPRRPSSLRARLPEGDVCCGGYDECTAAARRRVRLTGWRRRALLREHHSQCRRRVRGPADVGCMIPAPSAVPIPVPTTAPLPAPTTVPSLRRVQCRSRSRRSVPLPAPTAVPLPAPTVEFCGLGNPKGDVCCGGYEECHGSCGGAGCGSRDGGAALCCASTIRSAGVACEDPADVGCMIPVPSAVPIPVPTTVPLPAPTTVPVPAPSAVPLPVPTMTMAPLPAPSVVPLPAPTVEFCGLGNPKGDVCCGGYDECSRQLRRRRVRLTGWRRRALLREHHSQCRRRVRGPGGRGLHDSSAKCRADPGPDDGTTPRANDRAGPCAECSAAPGPDDAWHHSPRRPSCRSPRRPSSFAGSATRRGTSAAAAMKSATAAAAAPGAAHGMAAPRSAARAPFAVQASRARTRRTWAA